MTFLADVVAASQRVAATSARSTKVALIAELLAHLESTEIAATVGLLSGSVRQGKVGVGYATAYRVEAPPADTASLQVTDLDDAIDRVQATTGPGSVGERRSILESLLTRATIAEAEFIKRVFTGELRQGALEGIMTDAIAKASGAPQDVVRRAVMFSGDLCHVAELALNRGTDALRDVGFEIFRPVLPMLASTASSVAEAVSSFELASVEWKLDGIRIQVHRRGDEVRVYTRGLNDITESTPNIVEAARAIDAHALVTDGEALGDAGYLFDVLHVDGVDLLDEPLTARLEVLERIAPALRIPGLVTSDPGTGQQVLDEALAAGHEGVVVKDASSPYIAGRRGKSWRKVKPVRTYDLVVLGAEWGHGRRKEWLSNLHLGARDPSTGDFVMVGKCFKGLTDELLDHQTKEIGARKIEQQGIFVRARPELVVEIAIDGVQRSPRYPGGLALRFARVKRYRPDKSPTEADTIQSLQELL
ncbi:MAG: ATP-dependent DNA ligase [Actinomycetota bacterium]